MKDRLKYDRERVPAFIADCHLGKLAKYLRLLGFDTLYFNAIDDDALLERANAEQRIILTRDRQLYERDEAACLYLHSIETREQLLAIIRGLGLQTFFRPFSRCLRCNVPLEPVAKAAVTGRVPPKVERYFDNFQSCPACGRLFWHGDHYRRMLKYVESLLEEASVMEDL